MLILSNRGVVVCFFFRRLLQAFRAELRERLGAERFHYVALVDRLLYEEEVLLGLQAGGR